MITQAELDRIIRQGGPRRGIEDSLIEEIVRLRGVCNAASLRAIEASNPGIDMDEVKRIGGYV